MIDSPKKIAAFTLSEMMVVLVITLIVVGLAFSVLDLVRKQLAGIGTNYQNGTEINLFRQALWIDFQTYPNLYFDTERRTLQCTNAIKNTTYRFEEEQIIRERDTFAIQAEAILFFYDGEEVGSGPIDALQLKTAKQMGNTSVFVHQTNAADEYMN